MDDDPSWGEIQTCLDVAAPWSDALFSGAKTIETREYALPSEHVGERMALLDDSGGDRGLPALLLGTVSFARPFRYETHEQWSADTGRHLVPVDAGVDSFGWSDDVEKWGWPVIAAKRACYPVAAPPMARVLRSLFKVQWQPTGRVICRPDFRDRLMAAREALRAGTEGAASLLVLADFDRTLSAYAAPRETSASTTCSAEDSAIDAEIEVGEECHDVIFHHADLGDGFKRAVAPLLLAADGDKEAQTPQDMATLLNMNASDGSEQLSFTDWEQYATWWWTTAHDAMIEHGLTKVAIARAVSRAKVAMRHGTKALVRGCAETATPLVVVSAGITNVIDALMVAHVGPALWPTAVERQRLALAAADAPSHPPRSSSPPPPPVVVHANFGMYAAGDSALLGTGDHGSEQNERLVGFSPTPPIHWLNKILTTRPLASSLKFGSKVVVLLGDSVKDVTMVEGLAEEDVPLAVLKIGLLNTTTGDSPSDQLMEHMAVFDAVIAGDGPLDFVITNVLGELWNWHPSEFESETTTTPSRTVNGSAAGTDSREGTIGEAPRL